MSKQDTLHVRISLAGEADVSDGPISLMSKKWGKENT